MAAPASPVEGDFYINEDDLSFWLYESGAWVMKGYLSATEG